MQRGTSNLQYRRAYECHVYEASGFSEVQNVDLHVETESV